MKTKFFLIVLFSCINISLFAQSNERVPSPVSVEKTVSLYVYDSNAGKMVYSTDIKVMYTKTYVPKNQKSWLPCGHENGYDYFCSYKVTAGRNNQVWVTLSLPVTDSDIEGYRYRTMFANGWGYFNY